jgi:hypothetical protein
VAEDPAISQRRGRCPPRRGLGDAVRPSLAISVAASRASALAGEDQDRSHRPVRGHHVRIRLSRSPPPPGPDPGLFEDRREDARLGLAAASGCVPLAA